MGCFSLQHRREKSSTMAIQRRQRQQFISYKLLGCGYGQRPAKDQRCRPARMGVRLALTNTFKPGPTETTESDQATDPGMTQAWQLLTFLCHGFPQSWAFHQEWALLVTRLRKREETHVWGVRREKKREAWKIGWVGTAQCQGPGQSTEVLGLGGNRSKHGGNTENTAVLLKGNILKY